MPSKDIRTIERIREHYNIEKALASQLRSSNEEDRKNLYTSVYDQLFELVPDHPQLARKNHSESAAFHMLSQMKILKTFLNEKSKFLEIGAGDCSLSLAISKHVEKVYALDVSETMTKQQTLPKNFELIISDGTSIPVPNEIITIAYSNQLMEHLHPDDALKQLKNIYNSLIQDGIYICCTPNRLDGPHDISEYFDRVATGLHLKEYTITEVSELFSKVGFSQMRIYKNLKGIIIGFPLSPFVVIESILEKLPCMMIKKVTSTLLLRWLLNIIIVGKK
ncbi:MAG: methyltransferase domain-containing protein [Nostoc sp. S4]|nr:methyltransferase domain-containing protein [Nostoc sp. S4]